MLTPQTADLSTEQDETLQPSSTLFSFFVYLSLIAYIARIGELVPVLGSLRINLLLFAATAVLFVTSGARKNCGWEGNTPLKLTMLYLFVGGLSIPFSVWPGEAFRVCKDSLLLNTAVFVFCQAAISDSKRFLGIVRCLVLSCLVLLLGLHFKPVVVEGYRITTTATYDPNDIALLFAFAFPIVTSYFVTSKSFGKLIAMSVLLGLIIGILKTGSRGGLLALGIVVTMIFFSSRVQLRFFYKGVVIACMILFLLSPKAETIRDRFSALISGQDYNITQVESAAGGRLAIWKSGIQLALSNPILGVGAGGSSTAMGLAYGDLGWKTMHNSYLQALVELGLFGFLVFVLILRRTYRNCTKYLNEAGELSHHGEDGIVADLSLAAGLRIGLIGYMVAAFFLSQAFAVIVPIALALSSRLHVLHPVVPPLADAPPEKRPAVPRASPTLQA